MGTGNSHIPEQFPSLQSMRCRRCSGKPPSFFCSWWPHSRRPWVLLPGRSGDSPCGESYWWTCMFLAAGGASAAPWPSPPDRWTLDMKRDQCLLTLTDSLLPIFIFTRAHFTCVTGGPGVSWLTVADGCPALWNAAFPVPASLPPAGRRLLPSITVLTLVAFAALATVGVSLRQTLAVGTSGARKDKAWGQTGTCGGVCFTCACFMTLIRFLLLLIYLLLRQGFGPVTWAHKTPSRPGGQSHVTPVSPPSLHVPSAQTLQEWHPARTPSLW